MPSPSTQYWHTCMSALLYPLEYIHTLFLHTQITSFAAGASAAPGPNIFTDVAFECGPEVLTADVRRVFVSSASGAVFEINYNTCVG